MKIKNKYHIKKRFFVIFCVLSYVGICFGQQFYHIHTINQEIAGYVQEKKRFDPGTEKFTARDQFTAEQILY